MHRRGWTYFHIDGQVQGKSVSGRGRLPFVYSALEEHSPWMVLDIGGDLTVTDSAEGAYLRRHDGTVIAAYPAGTFFKGMARTWMGMHTVDIVRRDAAAQRIWFDTGPAANDTDVTITLTDDSHDSEAGLIYTIDMENDIIKNIKLQLANRSVGSLKFLYLQDIEGAGGDFIEPTLPDETQAPTLESLPTLWLIDLARQTLEN
jgi:hypothetical protein